MSVSRWHRQLPWFVALAAVVVHLPSVLTGFVHDDQQLIVNNPAAHGLEHVGACFGAHFWDVPEGAHSLRYYRPLVCASYALNWAMSQGAAWSFHLTNVLAHAAASLLATRFALRSAPHPTWAVAAALVFALHPSRTESVTWVSGRTDVFMAIFGLLAVELARIAARGIGARGMLAAAGALVALAAATLSKEAGVVFAVLCAYEASAPGGFRRMTRPASVAAFGTLALGAAYLAGRFWFPIGGPPLEFTPLHGFFSVGAYVERLIFPWPQTICYRPLTAVDGVTQYPLLSLGLGALAIILGVLFCVKAARAGFRASLLAATPFLFMAPLLHFVPTGLSYSTADRFLYMPAFLLVLALSVVFPGWASRLAERREVRLVGLGVVSVWSAITLVRAADYRSESAFWRHELSLVPHNPHVVQEIARLSAREGDLHTAAEFLGSYLSNPRHYPLIEGPASRAVAYARLLGLVAAETPDGDEKALGELFSELGAYLELRPELISGTAGGTDLAPLPTRAALKEALERNQSTLRAEAGFLSSRIASAEVTRRLLAGVRERDLSQVWNPANLVLAHARAFDFARARRMLELTAPAIGHGVSASLTRRIATAERWMAESGDRARAPLARALALAELGAYLRALHELRPLYEQERQPNAVFRLYVQLLVSARLEDEARREATALLGSGAGDAFVDGTRDALPARVRALPAVKSGR